jgi:hypothetical protein
LCPARDRDQLRSQDLKQGARRNEIFKVWKAEFPTLQARWVKLHVPRRSLLHFTKVRILP